MFASRDEIARRASRRLAARPRRRFDPSWSFTEVSAALEDERERYAYFLWFFDRCLEPELQAHRTHFRDSGKGFGEDAFHAMWFKIFEEFIPKTSVEIGVFRGQTITLWALLARTLCIDIDVWGISPLSSAGDSKSIYSEIDYQTDLHNTFRELGLGRPSILQSFSQDPKASKFMRSRRWDLVYIDGSHDYEDVVADVELSVECTDTGALIVLDDASLFAAYRPFRFAFPGHPGPSLVASRLGGGAELREIGTCGHNRVFKRL